MFLILLENTVRFRLSMQRINKKTMKKGETLLIISDDEEISNDIRKWYEITGNEFMDESEKDSEIEVYIRRAGV